MTYRESPDARHHLMLALRRHSIIGAAEGILMERHKINQRAAHQLLTEAADTSHRALDDVARRLTTTGDLNP